MYIYIYKYRCIDICIHRFMYIYIDICTVNFPVNLTSGSNWHSCFCIPW